jgi:LmbE family N-acetylglucosaminyl deacetylase
VSSFGRGQGKTKGLGTLVLSPHADDAALSLGGCLLAGALPGPVTIVTIFGESNFMDGAFHADVRAVTQRRRAEDEAFAAAAGARLLFWSNAEAALRPSASTGVFAAGFDVSLDEPAGLDAQLSSLLAASPPELVLSPLGLGCHRDHLLVTRLAGRLAKQHALPIAYYEDLPYAAAESMRGIRARARNIDRPLKPWLVSIAAEFSAKMAALRHYSSQIGAADMKRVAYHASRRSWLERARNRFGSSVRYPIERVWNRDHESPGPFLESSHP